MNNPLISIITVGRNFLCKGDPLCHDAFEYLKKHALISNFIGSMIQLDIH